MRLLSRLDPTYLPAGTKLKRVYKGKLYVVTVTRPLPRSHNRRWYRYKYKGKRYRSLSAIAREITGRYHESGPMFFGLTPRKRDKRVDESDLIR